MRMQIPSAVSLMQMPRTVLGLSEVKNKGIPVIVVADSVVAGGISASYAATGDFLFFEGKKEVLESPKDSQNLGLEMVYQDLALAGNLPIGENIFLGREPTRNLGLFKLLDFKKIKELMNKMGPWGPNFIIVWRGVPGSATNEKPPYEVCIDSD